jgi:hypothetical protein
MAGGKRKEPAELAGSASRPLNPGSGRVLDLRAGRVASRPFYLFGYLARPEGLRRPAPRRVTAKQRQPRHVLDRCPGNRRLTTHWSTYR